MNNYSVMVLTAFLSQQEKLLKENEADLDNFILDKGIRTLAKGKHEVLLANIKDLNLSIEILSKYETINQI